MSNDTTNRFAVTVLGQRVLVQGARRILLQGLTADEARNLAAHLVVYVAIAAEEDSSAEVDRLRALVAAIENA